MNKVYFILIIKHNYAVSCTLYLLSQTQCLWPFRNKQGKKLDVCETGVWN